MTQSDAATSDNSDATTSDSASDADIQAVEVVFVPLDVDPSITSRIAQLTTVHQRFATKLWDNTSASRTSALQMVLIAHWASVMHVTRKFVRTSWALSSAAVSTAHVTSSTPCWTLCRARIQSSLAKSKL